MSTATAPAPIKPPVQPSAPPLPPSAAPPPAIPPFPVRPLTVEQFEYLVDLGFYGDEKIELLDGWVVNKMTHGDLASFIIMRLSRQLGRTLSEAPAPQPPRAGHRRRTGRRGAIPDSRPDAGRSSLAGGSF
jgi:hypothetical protein